MFLSHSFVVVCFLFCFSHRTKIGLNPKFLQCLYFRNSVSFLGAGVNCSVPPHLQGAVVNLSIPPRLQGSYYLLFF
uniref:Secreted protein n=1 Tax=Anguilla anguilla TaxID=7936 RepID=A0A0E9PWE0_ANGAN